MRIIKYKSKRVNLLLNFIPSLWKSKWFGVRFKTFVYTFYINILLLGVQFRLIIYKPSKEVSISELKQIIRNANKDSNIIK